MRIKLLANKNIPSINSKKKDWNESSFLAGVIFPTLRRFYMILKAAVWNAIIRKPSFSVRVNCKFTLMVGQKGIHLLREPIKVLLFIYDLVSDSIVLHFNIWACLVQNWVLLHLFSVFFGIQALLCFDLATNTQVRILF